MKRWCALLALPAAAMRSVVLVRHGLSRMNVALARQPWGSPGFVDPGLWDAPLTDEGLRQAAALRGRCARDFRDVELVVSSPLTRALETAQTAWGDALARGVPARALPLAAERNYLSSDVGAPARELRARWPGFGFRDEDFPADEWWYAAEDWRADDWRPPGEYRAAGEPLEAYRARLERLLAWLRARPEESVALTCHWGVIAALTGESFGNCEARRVALDDLRVREDVAY